VSRHPDAFDEWLGGSTGIVAGLVEDVGDEVADLVAPRGEGR
jgi:hypothetical protein